MARVSLMIAFSVLAFVTARAYPSSQEKSTKDNANWTSLETVELIAIQAGMSDLCDSDETVENVVERGHNINLIQSFQPIVACVSNLIPWDIFIAEFITVTNETRSDFFPRYCPKLRTAGPCAQGVVKAVKPCLKEEDFTIVSSLTNVLPEVIELICQNDGEAIFGNYDPEYRECLENLPLPAVCDETLKFDEISLTPANMTNDQCGAINDSKECLQYQANMCGFPNIPRVNDLFHDALFRVTPCRDYIAGPEVIPISNITINLV